MNSELKTSKPVNAARERWLKANDQVSDLERSLFQVGSGYGDPDARDADRHRLESAKNNAQRLFHEYHDLDRRYLEAEMLKLQHSQRLATWASFAVAAAVGVATIVGVVIG